MTDQIKNYETSYMSMWAEIERARRERDNALKIVDVASDLIIALEHDMGNGHETKVSIKTLEAFNALQSRIGDIRGHR